MLDNDDPDTYRKLLRIDKHALDEELIGQPSLFAAVAAHVAHAISVRDGAYDARKVIEAELQTRLRRRAEEKGEKYTEKSIEAAVLKHRERLDAVKKLIAADRALNEWTAVKEAYQQRSYALKDLAGLHISGYFQSEAVRAPKRALEEKSYQDNRQAMQKKRRTRLD